MTAAQIIDFPDDDAVNKPSVSNIWVTPEMAKRWMERNTNNRPVKKRKVEQFARDMATGNWHYTGEPIKFSKTGRLIDGQNRLLAVIESNATVLMMVVRGLDDGAQAYMDSGTIRSNADTLGFLGYDKAKDLAPSVIAHKAWVTGYYRHAMVQSGPSFTKAEVVEHLKQHPGIEEVSAWVKRVQSSLPLGIGSLAACAYEFTLIDADAAKEFYDRIHDLNLGAKGSPLNTLVRRVASDRDTGKRVWVATGIYYQVRAWNAWRSGEELGRLVIGSSERGWSAIPRVSR